MRYPWLEPVGRLATVSGWALAGDNLPAAADRLLDGLTERTTPEAVTMLAEVRRRQGQARTAIELIRSHRERMPSTRSLPMFDFAEATACWTLADGPAALHLYQRARSTVQLSGDERTVIACRLGELRCARINSDRAAAPGAVDLLARVDRLDDPDLAADVFREAGAWALLASRHGDAVALARHAASIHEATGDSYLSALASIVEARGLHGDAEQEAGIRLVREALAAGRRIGSADVVMVATIFHGQFLQRGVTPDDPRWIEAHTVLTAALADASDAWTKSEILLPLAHLYLSSGMLAEAEAAIDDYQLLYRVLGGNSVADGNIAKFRARLAISKAGQLQYGGFRARGRSLVEVASVARRFRRAKRLYGVAGMTAAETSADWERHSILALLSGGAEAAGMPPREWGSPRDNLSAARQAFVSAKVAEEQGLDGEAAVGYARAERLASTAGATMLVVAACAGQAELAVRVSDRTRALAATRRAVERAELLRGAVLNGQARQTIAEFLSAHYERAAVIAATLEDPDLALEIAERLRTERISGMLARPEGVVLSSEISGLLDDIDATKELLARRIAPGGLAATKALAVRGPSSPSTGETGADLEDRLARVRAQLAERAGQAFVDVYDAPPTDLPRLLDGVSQHVLALVPLADTAGEYIMAVWRPVTGTSAASAGAAVKITPLDGSLRRLRRWLTDQHPVSRVALTAHDLSPLSSVLPEAMITSLSGVRDRNGVLVIPAGWLWGVPASVIPLGTGLLVEATDIALSPSLRVHQTTRGRQGEPPCAAVVVCSIPEFEGTEDLQALAAFGPGNPTTISVLDVRQAIVRGGETFQLAVVAAHGNREPGLAQALVDEQLETVLHAADFLAADASPPANLSVAACHGLYPPGDDPNEPLGLAVCAMTAGCAEILSSHFEVAFTSTAADVLVRTYSAMSVGVPMWRALSAAQRDVPDKSSRSLSEWAVFSTLIAGNSAAGAMVDVPSL